MRCFYSRYLFGYLDYSSIMEHSSICRTSIHETRHQEFLIRLATVTTGELLTRRREIRENLLLACISIFSPGSLFSVSEVQAIGLELFKQTLDESLIITALDGLEKQGVISRSIEQGKYLVEISHKVPELDELFIPSWEEFEKIVQESYEDYDLFIHKELKTAFNELLCKILISISTDNIFDNQFDTKSIEDIDKLIKNLIKVHIRETSEQKIFSSILFDYISSTPKNLLNLIFNCYDGLINIDIITREKDLENLNLKNDFEFLLLDTNFIISYLCKTDARHDLTSAILKKCRSYGIPVYYSEVIVNEMKGAINFAGREMDGLAGEKQPSVSSQFSKDFVRQDCDWVTYVSYITEWEGILQKKWGISQLDPELENAVDEESLSYYKFHLPLAELLKHSQNEKGQDIEKRTKPEKLIEDDAHCLAIISGVSSGYTKESPKYGPWYVTFDNSVVFISQLRGRGDLDIPGEAIHPKVLLNYFVAYTPTFENQEDREEVALAILRYTARANHSVLSFDEYLRILMEKIKLGPEYAEILRKLITKSPYYEALKEAIKQKDCGDADNLFYQYITSSSFYEVFNEYARNNQENEHLRNSLKKMRVQLEEAQREAMSERQHKLAYEKALERPIVINNYNYVFVDLDLSLESKIRGVIELLENENAFDSGVIVRPPSRIGLDSAREWLKDTAAAITLGKALSAGAISLGPYIDVILQSIC